MDLPIPPTHLPDTSVPETTVTTEISLPEKFALTTRLCINRFTALQHYYFPPELLPFIRDKMSNLALTTDTIYEAARMWIQDRPACIMKYGHISYWDTSRVTNMSHLFHDDELFENFDEPMYWDTSNVTCMCHMFDGAVNFHGRGLGAWKTGRVCCMESMFECTEINESLVRWDTSSVVNMREMFAHTSYNHPVNWWDVRHVITAMGMFRENPAFNQPMDNWQLLMARDITYMFQHCVSFNQNLSTWKLPNVWYMDHLFFGCKAFDQPVQDWYWCDCGRATSTCMFKGTLVPDPKEKERRFGKYSRCIFSSC